MLPLRDNIRSRSFSIMNWALIGINVLVFLYELRLGPAALQRFTVTYGMIPVRLNLNQPSTWLPVFTSMFLHGGWFHILTNMWVLFIFGDNVEDRMGPFNYLVFYILGGLVANLIQAFIYPTSKMPAIGASGAIAGVLVQNG
jgi:membrane associated rhomboid family serine protease